MNNDLVIEDLTVSYHRIPAVHHLTARLDTGSCTGLLGPNGAGKTTLLKALAGLLPLETGRIQFKGREIGDGLITYVPQREAVDWDFPITVRGLAEMGRYSTPHTPMGLTGCCTSTSTSSSPRWRCCAVPSWPAGRWSSAVTATRPAAPGRGDGVLRGAGVRRALGDAAGAGAAAVPRRRVPAVGPPRLRRRVGRGDGDAADVPGGRRGVGLGRGVRRASRPTTPRRSPARQGARARPDRAVVRGRHRRDPAAGQDRDRVRQARRRRPADPRRVDRDDGRTAR